MQPSISTYIINLKKRYDRKTQVIKEFAGKDEFAITIVEAIEHDIGAIGLWDTIKHIIQHLTNERDEYILIIEDDHQFTANYSKELLFESINKAKEFNAAILCGGIHWFNNAVQVADFKNLFWIEKFTGTQFIVVFKKIWQQILEADFTTHDAADYKISALTNNKFVIYPFISIQTDYGYSDCTRQNNVEGRMKALFDKTIEGISILNKVDNNYKTNKTQNTLPSIQNFDNIIIPTYVINLKERTERREHIEKQFAGRNEFDITIIDACKHKIGVYGLWMSIRKIYTNSHRKR